MLILMIAMAAAVGLVLTAAFAFRRLGRGTEDRDPGGATAGHAGSMLSALFLLVFAIAIVVPWTTADAARQNTYAEGQAAVEAYWSATGLPAPAGQEVQAGLRDYVRFVLDREWRLMERGRLSPEGAARLDALRAKVIALHVTGDDEQDARAAVLDHLRELSAARSQRAMDARARPPAGVLYLTVLLGLLVGLFPFLAGARPRGAAVVPLAVTAALLGVGIYLAFDISHVFRGALRVRPDAFITAQHELQRIPVGR